MCVRVAASSNRTQINNLEHTAAPSGPAGRYATVMEVLDRTTSTGEKTKSVLCIGVVDLSLWMDQEDGETDRRHPVDVLMMTDGRSNHQKILVRRQVDVVEGIHKRCRRRCVNKPVT